MVAGERKSVISRISASVEDERMLEDMYLSATHAGGHMLQDVHVGTTVGYHHELESASETHFEGSVTVEKTKQLGKGEFGVVWEGVVWVWVGEAVLG